MATSFQRIKDKARAKLHARMRVETLCYTAGPGGGSLTVYLRTLTEDKPQGDLAGTSLAYAERVETIPRLVFLHEDHTPAKGNVYVISDKEAYRVDTVEPFDGTQVLANATRLLQTELASYEAPA